MSHELIINAQGTTRKIETPYTPQIPEEQIIETPHRKINIGWRRVFDQITEITKVIDSAEICVEEGDYRVKLDRPDIPWALGLAFSDAHIGAYTSDHKLIKNLMDGLMTTPNSFLVDTGDTFNNGIWGGLQFEDVIPPYIQTFTVKDLARELGNKYAACVVGNHPEWMFSASGVKPEALFAEEIKGPIFAGMGLLHLHASNQEYDIALAHTYWGKSKKNIFNVCINFRQNEYPDADTFIIGHEHIWGHAKERVDGHEVLYVRPGTAKIKDRYARIHGIARRGQPMGIGILYRTDKHYQKAMDINEAIDFMKDQTK